MGIAYPNPPSFLLMQKKRSKENFSPHSTPIFQACYDFSLQLFNARNSPALAGSDKTGSLLDSKPKYYGVFANGRTNKVFFLLFCKKL